MNKADTYRAGVVAHMKAINQALAEYPEDVQAFMRRRFDLSLYPLGFLHDFARELDAFRASPGRDEPGIEAPEC